MPNATGAARSRSRSCSGGLPAGAAGKGGWPSDRGPPAAPPHHLEAAVQTILITALAVLAVAVYVGIWAANWRRARRAR